MTKNYLQAFYNVVIFDHGMELMHMFTGKKVSNFETRFSELVKESNKTLMQLAKELHVSNQTLSAWRNGTRSPKEPTVATIAFYFKVSVKWLTGFDVEKNADPRALTIPNSDHFRRVILAMSPEDYRTVMEIFERTEVKMRERGEL